MSNQQNDWFARPSETLSISPRATLHHSEAVSKLIGCPLSKFSLHSLSASWQKSSRLSPTVQLYFSWTIKMSDQQNHRFARPSESLSNSLNAFRKMRSPSEKFFWKSLKFKIRHCKNFQCPLSKISLHYQTVIDQRLTVFHQLFSWTSVEPSTCPIDKMIGLQEHLRVWAVPW